MSTPSYVLRQWIKWHKSGFGRWLFSKMVSWKAPYFATIKPRFQHMDVGQCKITMPNRRAVHNHIGTVHAIAMCNLAEMAAGTMIEASLPRSHRWIPKGMTVQYLAKAETHLCAEIDLEFPDFGDQGEDFVIPVDVFDARRQVVFHADITMWVTPRKSRARSDAKN